MNIENTPELVAGLVCSTKLPKTTRVMQDTLASLIPRGHINSVFSGLAVAALTDEARSNIAWKLRQTRRAIQERGVGNRFASEAVSEIEKLLSVLE